MRLKLKYTLPVAQMALAVALLHWSDVWYAADQRHLYSRNSPASFVLLLINAPVALLRGYWNPLPPPWDRLTFIPAIGIFWYWVGLNVECWRERKTVRLFTSVPLRITADLLLIGSGVLLFIVLGTDPLYEGPWRWFSRIAVLTRSLGPIFLFGRDLIQCIRANKTPVRKPELA